MMATLRNSSSKLFSNKYRNSHGGFSTTKHTLCKPFKHLSLTFSLEHTTTHLVTPISSLSSQHKQTEKQGQEIENIDESKTVCVKFQLERECSFGQHFFLVGNDPMLGLWNPINALQLNWSDGHIWTVELDVPIGKSIKFKFLLKGDTEEDVLWQPGPDRILQTWETETIRVCEDWEDAHLQKLVEEEESSCSTMGASVMATLVENLTEPIEKKDEAFALGVNGKALNAEDLESKENEGIMGPYKGELPVLVPGLTPLPTAHTDKQGSTNHVDKNFGSHDTNGLGEAKPLDVPEMQGVETDSKETTSMAVAGDKEEPIQEEEAEEMQIAEQQDRDITKPINDGVLENDIQWGRQTLQKFLSNFGIL